MSDVFDDEGEGEGEPSISMEDYLEAVEEDELVSDFSEYSNWFVILIACALLFDRSTSFVLFVNAVDLF